MTEKRTSVTMPADWTAPGSDASFGVWQLPEGPVVAVQGLPLTDDLRLFLAQFLPPGAEVTGTVDRTIHYLGGGRRYAANLGVFSTEQLP